MSEGIIIALIGVASSIIAALISAKVSSNKVMQQMQTEIALLKQQMERMSKDLAAHNNYAKLFSENIPVLQEKQAVANNRISDLEAGQKRLEGFHLS